LFRFVEENPHESGVHSQRALIIHGLNDESTYVGLLSKLTQI
jgi:hypothetical protein